MKPAAIAYLKEETPLAHPIEAGGERKHCDHREAGADHRADEAERALATLAKAVAHPARIRIIRMLASGAASPCADLVSALPLAQSTVSQHLKVLKDAGLITIDVDGARTSYRLEPRMLAELKTLVAGL